MTIPKIFSSLLITYLLSTLSPTLAAPQLQATIEPDQVTQGDSVILSLILLQPLEADSQGNLAPDIGPLKDFFNIDNQQQSIQQTIVNGQAQTQITWQYVLEPKKTGVLTIPALSVATSGGNLFSEPLSVTVTATKDSKRQDNMYLETLVANPKPYLHQPVVYTLRLYHRGDLRELQPLPPSNGVLTERLTDWANRRQTVNGQRLVVSEISYLLTPLQSGPLDLRTAQVKGLQPDTRSNSFGNSFFSFSTNYRPITFNSDPLTLEVQPPATSQRPWLPLQNLKVEQKWETDISQPVIIGVPLIRTLTLTAEGMGAQPFPELEKIGQTPDFRVRSPKPETQRKMLADGSTPVSTITQTFSLIPNKTGTLSLPAIHIPWWNLSKNTLQWTDLPAQTIQVIPNPNQQTTTAPATSVPKASATQIITKTVPYYANFRVSQYLLLTLSILALLIALWQSWYNRRFEVLVTATPVTLTTPLRMSDSTFIRHLQSAQDLTTLKQLLQDYAQLRWQMPKQSSLQTLATYVQEHYLNGEPVAELFKQFNATWYGGNLAFDLDNWKREMETRLTQLRKKKLTSERLNQRGMKLGPLNPV